MGKRKKGREDKEGKERVRHETIAHIFCLILSSMRTSFQSAFSLNPESEKSLSSAVFAIFLLG